MKNPILVPIILTAAALPVYGNLLSVDFENPAELATNWSQTFGAPDTFSQNPTAGINGSGGIVYTNDISQDMYVGFTHQTSIGGYQSGLTVSAKVHFSQVGVGNVFNFGLTTSPSGTGSLSGAEVNADWLGASLNTRSNFLDMRLVTYGFDNTGGLGGSNTLYDSGGGHPETFVPIMDHNGTIADGINPIDTWFGISVTYTGGPGSYDVTTTIDILNPDGTVAFANYAVASYSAVGGVIDGHSNHPDLNNFTDFFNASDLYVVIGSQRGAARNFAGADDIMVVPEPGTYALFIGMIAFAAIAVRRFRRK